MGEMFADPEFPKNKGGWDQRARPLTPSSESNKSAPCAIRRFLMWKNRSTGYKNDPVELPPSYAELGIWQLSKCLDLFQK